LVVSSAFVRISSLCSSPVDPKPPPLRSPSTDSFSPQVSKPTMSAQESDSFHHPIIMLIDCIILRHAIVGFYSLHSAEKFSAMPMALSFISSISTHTPTEKASYNHICLWQYTHIPHRKSKNHTSANGMNVLPYPFTIQKDCYIAHFHLTCVHLTDSSHRA
jgi:hypothetical protein